MDPRCTGTLFGTSVPTKKKMAFVTAGSVNEYYTTVMSRLTFFFIPRLAGSPPPIYLVLLAFETAFSQWQLLIHIQDAARNLSCLRRATTWVLHLSACVPIISNDEKRTSEHRITGNRCRGRIFSHQIVLRQSTWAPRMGEAPQAVWSHSYVLHPACCRLTIL